ncbi:MAG: hypothetical protein WCO45_06090 [Pseudanabaena sp. ELA607]
MRIRQPCGDHELELQLIHESDLILEFRVGNWGKLEAINHGRKKWRDNTFATAVWLGWIVIGYITVFYLVPSLATSQNLAYAAHYALIFGLPIGIFFYIIYCIYIFYEPCFIVWHFDGKKRQITQIKTNLFGKQTKLEIDFSQIKNISVEQHYDGDFTSFECTELYLALTSGKEFTLSQSSYDCKSENQAIAATYHQEIADQIRALIGLSS